MCGGVNWITAISIRDSNLEQASTFYEQAGDYLNMARTKNGNPEIAILVGMFYSKAFNYLRKDALERKTALTAKISNLRRKPSSTFKANDYSLLMLRVGEKHFRIPFAKYCSVAYSDFDIPPQKTGYHFVLKASIYLTIANLLLKSNHVRAGQFYEVAAQLQDYCFQTSTKTTVKDFKMIAQLYWNAAILQGFQSSFSEKLLSKSFYFFDLWLTDLKMHANLDNFMDVAIISSLTIELINALTPDKKELIEKYRKEYQKYLHYRT